MKHIAALVVALLLFPMHHSWSQQSGQLNLRQFMTPQEFRSAGLEKLSTEEFGALQRWFNRHTLNVFRVAQGQPSGVAGGRGYLVDHAVNDETFIISGNVFKAKTYCMTLYQGDRVVFAEGSASGACASAKLVNLRNGDVCEVWCE